MHEDEVIGELWEIKDRHAAKYNYDVRKMARALRRQQRTSGRDVVSTRRRSADTGSGHVDG
jgi:hypothetical protein